MHLLGTVDVFHSNSKVFAWLSVPQIESETSNSEKDLNVAIVHLETLGREINALKTKCANNSMAAARAEETATMARDKANEAKQVRMCTWADTPFWFKSTVWKACAVFWCSDSRWAVDRQVPWGPTARWYQGQSYHGCEEEGRESERRGHQAAQRCPEEATHASRCGFASWMVLISCICCVL